MLYFSKIKIILIGIFTIIFVYLASSNFLKFDDDIMQKKINLGLDLQGGSYLLLEVDNKPVITHKLQNFIESILTIASLSPFIVSVSLLAPVLFLQ